MKLTHMQRASLTALLAFTAILAFTFASWWGFSRHEALAFERLTGCSVTTYDAMFLQLRVVEPVVLEAPLAPTPERKNEDIRQPRGEVR